MEESIMKKIVALLLALAVLGSFALADDVEPGLLRTAIHYDISTMDVAQTSDNYMIPINVFDRLFETRPVGDSSEVVKSLVEDYSVSEDGLTYSFTLRPGIVFSNGNALTASDVQYSFERLLKVAKYNTDIPLEIVGGDQVMSGAADHLEGFSVTDDTHFSVTLAAPNAGFLSELSSPAMSVLDEETTSAAANFGQNTADIIGTGPYIVTEWVSNDHYTLVYNDKYWGEEPSVKKILVRVIPEPSTRDMMFKNGELDIIDLSHLDSAVVASTYKVPPYADHIVSRPKVGLTYLLMNEKNEFLQDVRVRKAIAMSIDVDKIIQGIFMGDAIRENGIIPIGIWGYADLEPFAYDPEGAKALLKEAGYEDGAIHFELSMDATVDTSTQLIYATISQQLAAVGIKAEVVSHDHSAWLALRSAGAMDSFVARWGMDYNDPANIMYTFFGSEENSVTRSLNYSDPSVIARVAAARSIVDDADRMAEYQALDRKLIKDDVAWVPMCVEQHLFCLGDRIASFSPHWAGFTDFYGIDVVLK